MIPFIPTKEELISVINRYSQIGDPKKGGFKVFYPATKGDGTKEALKLVFIPPFNELAEHLRIDLKEEIKKRVEREISLLRKAKSPFIVKLGDLVPTNVTIRNEEFIVYSEELLPGKDLSVLINERFNPNERELRQLAVCLLDAIIDLWFNLKTVHRDIKPLNIIKTGITDRPFVLLDLGIAFSIYESALTIDPGRFPPPGTLRYLAPEMLKPNFRETLDYRSDLYTTGVTLFEFASGQHPLAKDRDDLVQTITRILRDAPRLLETLRSDLSTDFTDAVNQLVKKIPALRPANIYALKSKLEVGK